MWFLYLIHSMQLLFLGLMGALSGLFPGEGGEEFLAGLLPEEVRVACAIAVIGSEFYILVNCFRVAGFYLGRIESRIFKDWKVTANYLVMLVVPCVAVVQMADEPGLGVLRAGIPVFFSQHVLLTLIALVVYAHRAEGILDLSLGLLWNGAMALMLLAASLPIYFSEWYLARDSVLEIINFHALLLVSIISSALFFWRNRDQVFT